MSRQAAQALMRIFAIGESATSMTSAPAWPSVVAAATSLAALKDRGGSISTAITTTATGQGMSVSASPPRGSAAPTFSPAKLALLTAERLAEVRGWIETAGLAPATLPLDRELTLLMASAPWIGKQFDLKGIDLLLAAAAKLPFLRLILLWRGVLADELARRVERLGVANRVEIVNRKVNVNDYLKKAHAAVVLARNGGVVRSFPHSLIESLLAGKPVLLSETIAMADYVRSGRCGVVVPDMSMAALTSAIDMLMRGYEELARNASQIEPGAFSMATMVEKHRRVYARSWSGAIA
jgi:glycosyltransferase involved in cell wall biosynthesis